MYLLAPTNKYFQPSIKIKKAESEIIIPVKPDFFHAGGAVHGNVYFKAMDDASYFAVNSIVEDYFVLTAVYEIKMLEPVNSGTLSAIGRVTEASRKIYSAESELFNSAGKLVGRGKGKFLRSHIRLTPEIGYI